jgi:uncharacterized protein
MPNEPSGNYTLLEGDQVIARGDLVSVARAAYARGAGQAIVLSDLSGRLVEIDLRGTLSEVLTRLVSGPAQPTVRRGRPKLGVTAREVTLLPRHWDWLATQPGGASAVLRRLVDQARREKASGDERRQVQEAVYRVATTLGGDRPGYEEAIRALFAGDIAAFHARIAAWPPDIAAYLRDLAAPLGEP